MSSVSVSNCIKFYQTAEDIGAEGLRKYCEEIITSHWVQTCFTHLVACTVTMAVLRVIKRGRADI